MSSTPTTAGRPPLDPDDLARLELLLKNEADPAFRRRAMALIAHLGLRAGDRLLDCGCGMGVYLMMIGRLRSLQMCGADGDLARLRWARAEGVQAPLVDTDLHRLPFADGSFNKVLMSEVLEHLEDEERALREVYRVLEPGGVLALSVPHADYPFWYDPINKTLEAVGAPPITAAGPITGIWSNHHRLYRPGRLTALIASCGFAVEAWEAVTHYAFPFVHLIVYSVGKPLIEHNLLPPSLRVAADRFRAEQNSGSLLNPVNLGVRLIRLADARNDRPRGDERTFVNLVVRARKPLAVAG